MASSQALPQKLAAAKQGKSKVKLAQSQLNFASSSNVVSATMTTATAVIAAAQPLCADTNANASLVMESLMTQSDKPAVQEDLSVHGSTVVDAVPPWAQQGMPLGKSSSKGTCNWSDIVNEAERFISGLPVAGHKLEVAPIFLNFKQVAREGFKIPLIEVAAAVGRVVGDINVDGIQLMQSGWQIYVKTEKD